MSLYINTASQTTLETLLNEKPHALLLSGKPGIGLYTIASAYAKQVGSVVLTVLPEKNEVVDIEKGTITIQSIRRLYDLTKTIEPKGRSIIIDYAERMGIPAQNAFLKLLEEPPTSVYVLLLAETANILATVRSRVRVIDFSAEQAQARQSAAREAWANLFSGYALYSPAELAEVTYLLQMQPLLHIGIKEQTFIDLYKQHAGNV